MLDMHFWKTGKYTGNPGINKSKSPWKKIKKMLWKFCFFWWIYWTLLSVSDVLQVYKRSESQQGKRRSTIQRLTYPWTPNIHRILGPSLLWFRCLFGQLEKLSFLRTNYDPGDRRKKFRDARSRIRLAKGNCQLQTWVKCLTLWITQLNSVIHWKYFVSKV